MELLKLVNPSGDSQSRGREGNSDPVGSCVNDKKQIFRVLLAARGLGGGEG